MKATVLSMNARAIGFALLLVSGACGGESSTGAGTSVGRGTGGESGGGRGGAESTAGRGGATSAQGGQTASGTAGNAGGAGSVGVGAGGSAAAGGASGDGGASGGVDAPVVTEDAGVPVEDAAVDARPALATGKIPQPWKDEDIGMVGVPGASGRTRNNFQVQGSGGDVWADADAFHFLSRQVTGDAEIVARVASMERTSGDAKAGLMFRESSAPDARNVFMLALPAMMAADGTVSGKGSRLQYREKRTDNLTAFSDLTSARPGVLDAPPLWLRLVRKGALFQGFVSADGADWKKDGEVMMALPPELAVGLAVTSHANTNAGIGVFEQLRVTALTDATWAHDELGTLGGYAAGAPRRFDIMNAGRGIANDEDGISFVHQTAQRIGDVEITAKVTALSYAGTKAASIGVMLRGMLRGDARMASFMVELGPNGQRYRLQRRAQDGGNISNTEDMTLPPPPDGGAMEPAPAPNPPPVADAGGDAGTDGGKPQPVAVELVPTWIKLVRVGHRFVGFVSEDGKKWRLAIDLPSFVIASNAFAGVALTSATESGLATGRIENVTIVSPPVTMLPALPDAGADGAAPDGNAN